MKFDSSKHKWAASLLASDSEAQLALARFADGPDIFIRTDILPQHPDRPVLLANKFNKISDPAEVDRVAEETVAVVNGILYLDFPKRVPISVRAVYEQSSPGSWSPNMTVQTGVYEFTGFGTLSDPRAATWLAQTSFDLVLFDVLSCLREDPTWDDLWRAFEAIRDEVRDPKLAPKPSWFDDVDWKRFATDSQTFRHSRRWLAKRHVPPSTLTLRDARSYVRKLVARWLEWRPMSARGNQDR